MALIPGWLSSVDQRIIGFARRHSLNALRISLGIVFLWFGALKLLDASPVASLVTSTLFFLPPQSALLVLGAFEVLVGLGLISGWAIRITLLLFTLQMLGTFLVFVVLPHRAFQGDNPLMLTQEGEFVLKNLILVMAGFAIASAVPKARPGTPLSDALKQGPGEAPTPRQG